MGDRTYAYIRFSGAANREVAEDLLVELANQGCLSNEDDDPPTLENLAETFYDSECNYASMEGVELFCQLSGISYVKTWEPGGSYGAGIELYNAVVNQSFQVATSEGEPVLTLGELMKIVEEGKDLNDVIEYLKTFVNSEDVYPPLKIID